MVGGSTPAVVTGSSLAGSNLSALIGNGSLVLSVDDVFLKNNADDETTGTLTINIDKENDTVTLDDEFRYTGTFGANQPDPVFTAQLGLTGNNTLILSFAKPNINESGTINISIRSTH